MSSNAFRRLLCAALVCWPLLGMLLLAMPSRAAEPYREDAVKAAFLVRFTGYVEWPEQAFRSKQFTIAVLGSSAVAEELSKLVVQHPAKDLPTRVRIVESAAQAEDAQMLYVGPEYLGDLRDLTESLASQPILVVTDHFRGLDEGGAVNFMLVDRRVRFEVSLTAAHRAGIKIDSDLLSVAARVRGGPLGSEHLCAPSIVFLDGKYSCLERVARL